MSSSNDSLIDNVQNEIVTLNWIVTLISQWITPLIFLFAVICNLLNIYVFTRSPLRRNPCAMYFLASSLAAFVHAVFDIPLRALQLGYNIDPTSSSLVLCKIKSFFVFSWRALILWFLVLACIDRFLRSSSNARGQQWSSFKVASRAIPLTILVVHVAYLHVAIFYQIDVPAFVCTSGSGSYQIFIGIWHLVAYGIGPPLLMFVLSLLTIRHVRHPRIVCPTMIRNSSKDRHLLHMLFAQCLFISSTTMTYGIGQLYTSLTAKQYKDHLQVAKINLFLCIVGNISAFGHNTTFFVFTLTSKMFRQQLFSRRPRRV